MMWLLKNSLFESFQKSKSAHVIYLLGLMASGILGLMALIDLMRFGQYRMTLNELAARFDLNLFHDFFFKNNFKFEKYIWAALTSILFFKNVLTFITGGIIDHLYNSQFSLLRFFTQSKKFFWRFFKISILETLIFLLLIATFIVIVNNNSDSIGFLNEKQIFLRISLIIIPLIVLYYFASWGGDLARIKIYETDNRDPINTYFGSVIEIMTKPKYWLAGKTVVIAGLLLLFLYLSFEKYIVAHNVITIILVVILQQSYIWLKGIFKIWHLNNFRNLQRNTTVGFFE